MGHVFYIMWFILWFVLLYILICGSLELCELNYNIELFKAEI